MASLKSLSNLWKRAMLRGTAFAGRYDRVRLLYFLADPWEMASPREQHRFRQTQAQLKDIAPRFESILELGCGEGHQSQFLQEICTCLDGVDISPLAVRRAARRCPQGHFHALALEDVDRIFAERRFDLITACEVLYYARDIGAALSALQARTDRLYVSNFRERAERMRGHFEGEGWRGLAPIRFEGIEWECRLWEAAGQRVA